MEYRQVVYFRAVAACGSISAASALLHIAQPAISAQILGLERELGKALFERHARGVRLTAHGHAFSQHANLIVSQFEAAKRAVQDVDGEAEGRVVIGLPTTVANVLVGPLLTAMRRECPNIEPVVVEALSGEIERWYRDGRFDLAVLYQGRVDKSIRSNAEVYEPLWAFGKKSTLGHFGSEVSLSDLSHFSIYHTSPIHTCRATLDAVASEARVPIRVVAEIDSVVRLCEMALHGPGVAIFLLASVSWTMLPLGHVCRIVSPGISLFTTLETRPGKGRSRATCCALDVTRRVMRELVADGTWLGARTTDTTV